MALTIGRVGIDEPTLQEPETWHHTGEIVTIRGTLDADTVIEAKALRQQVLGLNNNRDEPIVPVTWDQDSWVDGYYRVLGAEVNTVPASLFAAWFEFAVTLERIPEYTAPLIEEVSVGAEVVRDTDTGYTTEVAHFFSVPGDAAAGRFDGVVPIANTIPSADGDITAYIAATLAANNYAVAQYTLAPADFYNGAARFELDYADDGTFRPVVGRQHLQLPGDARWAVDNGVFRVFPADGWNAFRLGTQRWWGLDYTSPRFWSIGYHDSGDITEGGLPDSITILRNDPLAVVVRLTFDANIGASASWGVADITLRRGAVFAEIHLYSYPRFSGSAIAQDFGIGYLSGGTGVAIAGSNNPGIHLNALDSDDMDAFILSARAFSTDLTDIELWTTSSVTSAPFAIGMARDADPANYNHPTDQARYFFNPRSNSLRFVSQ